MNFILGDVSCFCTVWDAFKKHMNVRKSACSFGCCYCRHVGWGGGGGGGGAV